MLRLVTHNTVSVDGATTGFPVDVGLHYEIAGRLAPAVMLVGSAMARTGIELFMARVPRETPADRQPRPPLPGDTRPAWVIVDSRGALHGLLHVFRNDEHVREVSVLVSKSTPAAYLAYLAERGYPALTAGDGRVDLRRGLEQVAARHGEGVVLTDSGGGLNRALLRLGLVDQLSLVVAPRLAGSQGRPLFWGVAMGERMEPAGLRLAAHETLRDGHAWLLYDVAR